MTFEQWWEDVSDVYFDNTGTYPNDVTKSFSKAAWEAAQAQEKVVVGEIKEACAEYPSLMKERER